jgi:uncharacterized protein (DUF2252 family)
MRSAVVPMAQPKKRKALGPTELPPSTSERYTAGKTLRDRLPREQHDQWTPSKDRRDPVKMVIESSKSRIPELVPIRYGRMMVSPFTFYRGTANIMASDLAATAITGIQTQLCGDCHLLNLGGFATPERRVIFDTNDFDETLPGPWEWDLKRLVASFIMACRSNGFSKSDQREAAEACARSYRESIANFANMPTLDVWYAYLTIDKVISSLHDKVTRAQMRKHIKKEEAHESEHHQPSMIQQLDGKYVIKDDPPLVYHHQHFNLAESRENILEAFTNYRDGLRDDRRVLLDRYRLVDFALKVVGVGSVGTLCAVALLMASDNDPLFLQIKEAGPSVLESYLGKSAYEHHGQRVVTGQRLMQAASDIFLGWTQGKQGKHFYIRQLRDVKVKILVEAFNPTAMVDYATLCGWTLAHTHAKSGGDSAVIAGYLGKSDIFDRAITRFSEHYSDQVERDHAEFMKAIREGRIEVETER